MIESGDRSVYVPQTDVHGAGKSVITDKVAHGDVHPWSSKARLASESLCRQKPVLLDSLDRTCYNVY
jgi:hypothetical protein